MSVINIYNGYNNCIDLDANDYPDIIDIRPFKILNTICIASNIAYDINNEINKNDIYNLISEYLINVTESIFDDVCTILDNNDIDVW